MSPRDNKTGKDTLNKKKTHIMAEYTIIIEHDPVTGLYCGQCQQLPEAISQGRTEDELMANIQEAIELVLEDRAENMKRLYSGRSVTRRRIAVSA